MTKSSFLPVSFKHHRITIQEPLPDFLNICELVFYFCLIESLEEAKGHQPVNFQLQYLLILSSYQIIKKKLPGESLSNLEFHLHVSEQQSFHSWAHSHMAGKSHPTPPKIKTKTKKKKVKNYFTKADCPHILKFCLIFQEFHTIKFLCECVCMGIFKQTGKPWCEIWVMQDSLTAVVSPDLDWDRNQHPSNILGQISN